VWLLALARWSGRLDLTVTVCAENRHRPETRELVAYLMNTLPVRVRLDGSGELAAAVDRVQAATRRAYQHGNAPLEAFAGQPFPVAFGYFDAPPPVPLGPGTAPVSEVDVHVPVGYLSLDIVRTGGQPEVSLLHDARRHAQEFVAKLGECFVSTVDDLAGGAVSW
jgi:hypothetical protein